MTTSTARPDLDNKALDSYRLPWMTDDQWECFDFIAWNLGGFHHVRGKPKPCGTGIEINLPSGRWATFDFSSLTRLVVSAHDRCIRVEIDSSGPRLLKFVIHKRHSREGKMHKRHPTIEDAIASIRPAPQKPT